MELEIRHQTRYDYAAPVSLAHHLAHLQPLSDAHQQLLDFQLEVQPSPDHLVHSLDAMGNAQCHFSLAQPHRWLEVHATSRVWVAPRFDELQPDESPDWTEVAQRLRYVAGCASESALEYAQPSPFVPRLAALRDYGAASFSKPRPVARVALELMQRIHEDFKYESYSTEIETPLEQVLEQRQGVCQDFAHLMAGVLRMWGLPARYVSGYLLTQAPEGGATMLGADASHAWVQVWCPQTPGVGGEGWLDLDPTNNIVPGSGHVRVALGRDFGDVTPLRGVIRGGGSHRLSVGVSTRAVSSQHVPGVAAPQVATVK